MHETEKQAGVVYEVRTLTNRWEQPMGNEVLSSHDSADAALAANEPVGRPASDGILGRSTHGGFVPNVVVRVDTDGSQSVTLPKPVSVR